MKKENKTITIGLLLMVLIAVVIWAFNQFIFRFLPSDYNNPYIILVFFAGIIGTFAAIIKGIRELVNLGKPQKDEPGEIEGLLGELRALQSISDKKAHSYVSKILGDESNDFWSQLMSHKNVKTLNELIQDPFMLEGLLCVYRTKQGKLPQNIGALLDNLIRIQWVPEKLLLDNWIPIESVLWALGELVYSHVPEQRYPIWHEFTSNQDSFENMLIQIGTKENDWLRKVNKLELEYKVLDRFDRSNPHLFDKVISTILIYLFHFWSHNIFCTISYPGKIRRAKRLLQAAEKAHFIHLGEVHLHFNHKFWVDYFAARFIVHYSNMIPEHLYDGVNSGARSLDDKVDIAVIICGLIDNIVNPKVKTTNRPN
ncbi:MAG: hypothetical protein JEZ00_19595 [Anaerolineaceae bacterium]|nr:hypothetical protein [Anaerolineaceae bacterium]